MSDTLISPEQVVNAKDHPPFEGPEKTLEIDWVPGVGEEVGLRTISKAVWEELLQFAKCRVLSLTSNENFDSFVLSESSMFVYQRKLIIKTCGTTTLLCLLPALLTKTRELGLKLEWLGYSRKNFSFPHFQIYPHGDFAEEVSYLRNTCGINGEAYVLGPLTSDHWTIFVFDDCDRPMSESTDRTLNMMMYDIHPTVAKVFWKDERSKKKNFLFV